MTGTIQGGKKASITNKRRHGKDFYKRIGAEGGRNGHTGGFAANRELARIAGKKGGTVSTRAGIKNGQARTRKQNALKLWLKKLNYSLTEKDVK